MSRAPLLAGLLTLVSASAVAHDFALTDVRLVLDERGRFHADITCDLDALALGVDPSADSAALAAEIAALPAARRRRLVEGLVELLRRRLRVRFDGAPTPFEVSLPEDGRPEPPGAPPTALGLVARLSGQVPAGARAVSFFASRAFPPVRLSVRRDRSRLTTTELLPRGVESQPVPLVGSARLSAWATAGRLSALGFTHIVPFGVDHVLFVVGLTLLSPRLKPLLAQVSAFTVAHTVTLALSIQGVVQLPSQVVETLIALSIVYVGVENLVRTRLTPSRLALVFGFGLLHGLGFAGVLRELGWPSDQRLVALLALNLGVELGQLAVIAPALASVRLAARWSALRRRLPIAASLGIAALGLYMAVERAVAG